MKKLISIGALAFTLALSAALVWGSSGTARADGNPESVASIPRKPIVVNTDDVDDDEGGDEGDGTDNDGV